jgi:parallel beta-helix repeat protein
MMPRSFLPLLLAALPAFATDWHVAPDGDDAWSGRLPAPNAERTDGPFATLTRARDAMRQARPAGHTVHVRGGTYELTAPLKLGAEDSGTREAPVVWRAFEKEKPVLIGGRRIGGFQPWKGEILRADVAAQGFKDAAFRQLFFAGKRQHLARYPNFDPQNPYGGGWAYAGGEPWPMYADLPGEDKRVMTYRPQDAREWARPEEVEVFVFPRFNWWNNIVRIAAIDREKRRLTLAQDPSYAVRHGDHYFFQNALEELDAPGEWYLDRQAGALYFWPPAPLTTGEVLAPTARTILELGPGAAFITVRGFTLECCEGTAVVLDRASDCLIAGNTIRNAGDYSGGGVEVRNGTRVGIVGNDIHAVGRNAISLSGGDRTTLTRAGNFAENNYLHHFGVFYKQGVGVALEGCGHRVAHNLIHDGPRFGILHSGNLHEIEFNHIRHVSLETEDTGAIYSGGRDWLTPRGTRIAFNFIHDIWGYGQVGDTKWVSPYFAWGIYLDDNSGGADVIGNIVARCARGGLHAHSARDNRIENNVWVDNGQWQVDFHGWKVPGGMWDQHFPSMVKGYESVADQPAWKAMRNMHLHPRDAVRADGLVMSGNVFRRNILAFRDPNSRAYDVQRVPFEANVFDHNLVWNHGHPPKTGHTAAGRDLGPNLVPNAGFEDGEPGKLPRDWQWQIRPNGTAIAALAEIEGRRVLRIEGALARDAEGRPKTRDQWPIVGGKEFTQIEPGRSYRLRARLRASKPGAQAAALLQCWVPPSPEGKAFFWGGGGDVKVGTEWQDFEAVFTVPGPGAKGHDPRMKRFRVRFDFKEEEGALFVDDVSLHEVEPLSEWAAWQALGNDRHSLVADPKFVAPEKDDYRLQPDSPAWALGFERIPVEKIGLYADDLRASWPIVEAEGAREQPPGRN